MSVAVAVQRQMIPDAVDTTQQEILVYGTLTLTGNYGGGATHGDTLNFGGIEEIKSNSVPNQVEIWEQPTAGNAPTGYQFVYAQGTDKTNGLLQVLQNGAGNGPNVEITQGAAYPAALLAATANIKFCAWFPKFV